ncbi:porin [Polynucleobacter paneuropaeus]|nr:porin [Polynucleobacter paneuropaeus]MBT8637770.1 porin [Polynucleobacter paneuropaeus]
MKKSLFALAAVSAIAGTAQAQSSVTVYGVMDLGYAGSNYKAAGQPAGATQTGGASVATNNTSSIETGAESTSRLGFKGNEDLGGGLSAFFTIETALTPNNQQAISTSANTANRQTFVGLKKNGIGSFAIGTQYTTIHNAVAATDPGMQNNMAGNVIYDKTTATNTTYWTQATSSVAGTGTFSAQQDNTSYTVRANNMLSLTSDTFAGFQGNAFYVLNNANTNQTTTVTTTTAVTGGTNNHTGFGLGANYTWNKLLVTANFQQFTDKQAYTISNTTGAYSVGAPAMGGFGGTTVPGTNDKDNQQYYAATYDFGMLKAYVQYVNRKTLDANNPNNYVARTAQQIGVRSFITPTVEAWASTGTGKYTVSTGSAGTNYFVAGSSSIGSNAANFGAFQLGSNYWLSKRTNLYAIYGQQHTSNQSYTSGANPVSYNENNYAVGVRHTF